MRRLLRTLGANRDIAAAAAAVSGHGLAVMRFAHAAEQVGAHTADAGTKAAWMDLARALRVCGGDDEIDAAVMEFLDTTGVMMADWGPHWHKVQGF